MNDTSQPVANTALDGAGSQQRWFQRRPIPVWIIFALSALQMYGIFVAMHEVHYLDAINRGLVSPIHAFVGLIYPLLLFIGATLLFFMRKASVFFFVAFLAWGLARISLSMPYSNYLGLALDVGICIYALRLAAQGKLR
jgi:hypothetical protein